jgi:hypothetical protein
MSPCLRTLAAAGLACLAAACGAMKGAGEAQPVAPAVATAPAPTTAAPSSADNLLAYVAYVRALPEAGLAAEAAKRRREAGDVARLKAAIALAFSSQAEESDILTLVEPLEKRTADRDVRAMAGFLQAMALERRRVKENASARLRDEHKALDAQRQRAESLQQKLDALSELEKSLSAR